MGIAFDELLLIVKVAVLVPTAAGVKETRYVQVAPAATVALQVGRTLQDGEVRSIRPGDRYGADRYRRAAGIRHRYRLR